MRRFRETVNMADREEVMDALKKLYGEGVSMDGEVDSNREPGTACVSEVDKVSTEV